MVFLIFSVNGGARTLKTLLSFAVGGLLGDVFLHLLPEAWASDHLKGEDGSHPSMRCGLWVLGGMLIFIIVEKLFAGYVTEEVDEVSAKCGGGQNGKVCDIEVIGGAVKNGCCIVDEIQKDNEKDRPKHVAGYLNLMANSIDNFTHGLAVGGSFIVSFRLGVLTTFAILVHEIPHEVGDFAILLRSGFSRWDAARAQLLTAGAGLLGAMTAIGGSGATSAIEARTSWIMPFTAGGFLHIALVTVLPDLVREDDRKESFKHFASLIGGIALMATLTYLLE